MPETQHVRPSEQRLSRYKAKDTQKTRAGRLGFSYPGLRLLLLLSQEEYTEHRSTVAELAKRAPVQEATAYVVLGRMHKLGWVSRDYVPGRTVNGRGGKFAVYHVTPDGKRAALGFQGFLDSLAPGVAKRIGWFYPGVRR